MHRVLIIDDEPPVRRMLGLFLRTQGFEVLEAEDGQAGLEVFEEHTPPFVLTDVRMPRMNGLELVRRVRALDSDAAIVVITGHGGEETAIEALRAGATNYLKKPIEIKDLSQVLRRYVEAHEARLSLLLPPFYLEQDERVLELDNELDNVPAVITYLTATAHLFFPRAEVNYIKLGLDEMIRNAIEHGNFAITYEEKTQSLEHNRWLELLDQRRAESALDRRRVRVRCTQTPEAFRCVIADEGDGFNWRDLPDPADPANLLSSHGRGILLTTFYFDEVVYNDRGNAVTLVKRVRGLDRPAQPAASAAPAHAG